MRRTPRTLTAIVSAALLAAGAVGVSASANAGHKEASWKYKSITALGLGSDGTTLSSFSLGFHPRERNLGTVSGLAGDTALIGIDHRVQDGSFYGVGNAGGIYTIDTRNAEVTKVSQLTVALSGSNFGVDFNPAADRLRVISDNGQNLRHNVNAGGATLVDKPLAYVAGTPATGLSAAAYTNNDLSASTATTLFDIDSRLDQVVLQVPANDGALSVTGSLGLDVGAVAGFDILSRVQSGVTVGNAGYAVLKPEGASRSALYEIDLLSGNAAKLASFRFDVADLAVARPR